MRAVTAGAAYFALIFALGFVLGAARTLVLAQAPDLSRLEAVLIEAPVMLAASWLACGFVVRRFAVPAALALRALMGAAAFALLMASELALAVLLLGQTPAEHLAGYREPSRLVGLLAQIAFGLFPVLRRQ